MTFGASDHLRAVALALAAVFLLLAALWWVETERADAMRGSLPVTGAVAPAPTAVFDEQPAVHDAPLAVPANDVPATTVSNARAVLRSRPTGQRATPMPRQMLVRITRDVPVFDQPGGVRSIGVLPARSRYLGAPMTARIMKRTADGAWGLVNIPWSGAARGGWISLAGLETTTTSVQVRASLRERRLRVWQRGRLIINAPAAVGAASSPSPTGRFYVTDPTPVPAGQPQFGGYAFGLSAIQPNTPPGWTGGNQMAIHGTNDPGSIGTAVSAGCLRVSAQVLARLRTMLVPGTPVIIEA